MTSIDEFIVKVLYKLWRNKCFGHGHMLIDTVVGGFANNEAAGIRDAIDRLYRKNWVVKKPTKHGMALYINLTYKREIERELRNRYSYL